MKERSRIRIRTFIKMDSRIRIRIKSFRIRNSGSLNCDNFAGNPRAMWRRGCRYTCTVGSTGPPSSSRAGPGPNPPKYSISSDQIPRELLISPKIQVGFPISLSSQCASVFCGPLGHGQYIKYFKFSIGRWVRSGV